jgi:hypothetical protein
MLLTARWIFRPFPLTTLIRLYKLLMNSLGALRPLVNRYTSINMQTTSIFIKVTCMLHFMPQTTFAAQNITLNTKYWWRMTGSNRRPPACKAGALPAELIPLVCRSGLSAFPAPPLKNGGSGWSRTNDPRLIKTVL